MSRSGSSVAGGASGTVCSATSGRGLVVRIPNRPEDTVCVHGHGLGSRRADQEICIMLDCSVAKQSRVALSSGEAEFYGIVRAVATSKQTSQILEQIGMQLELTIASDSSAARGICTKTGSGKVRYLSVKQLWLNWADIGTKAHTSECLTSLLRQMPLRLGEEQKQALACLVKSNENSGRGHGGMEKIATHCLIQKSAMDAMVKGIAMGDSNQRATNTVGNQE